MEKQKDWRIWLLMLVTMATLAYTVISSYAIRGNDLKHIQDDITKIEKRLERIEGLFMTKGE